MVGNGEMPSEEGMNSILLVFALINTVAFFFSFFMKSHPPSPPSHSAHLSEQEDATTETYKMHLVELFKNRNYWLLFLAFGIGGGIFNSLATLLQQIIAPAGYNDDDAGTLSIVMICKQIVYFNFATV